MTAYQGTIAPAGKVGIVKIPKEASPYTWKDIVKHGLPQRGLAKEVNAWRWRNLPHLWRGLRKVAMAWNGSTGFFDASRASMAASASFFDVPLVMARFASTRCL